jgi:large subunit ribosomal protein L32
MAVPKKKTSKSKSKMRSAHLKKKLSTINYVEDKNSGELRRPHHIDRTTGEYRGKKIIDPTK